MRFNNIFGYYIEVSKPNLRHVPADYERKQTLVNAERFTTPELKDLERNILSADERGHALELELFTRLRQLASEHAAPIRRDAAAIAELDLLANFAHLAAEHRYCQPEMGADILEVRAGRHPVVERLAFVPQGVAPSAEAADRFVPNDLHLDPDSQRVLLITGPNMGGKSTYLRQAALIAVMAQMGSFVPADAARLPVFDRIFTRIGASDNLARGRSTFMVEMTEAAVILNQATARSLVILDEIGRGTSTYDGLA
ncbi:MAG: MutS-related protein, partial [Terriglobales bacterium]